MKEEDKLNIEKSINNLIDNYLNENERILVDKQKLKGVLGAYEENRTKSINVIKTLVVKLTELAQTASVANEHYVDWSYFFDPLVNREILDYISDISSDLINPFRDIIK